LMRDWLFVSLSLFIGPVIGSIGSAQQVSGQDIDKVFERGEKLLDEAKSNYESGKAKSSLPLLIEAGFKLEEAKVKFQAIQELGPEEKQKVAGERLKTLNQLAKLVHDAAVAASASAAQPPAPKDPAEKPPANPPDVKLAPPVAMNVSNPARLPKPPPSKLQEGEKGVRELYKVEYAKKSPADRRTLARSLFDQLEKNSQDPAVQWILLRDAQDFAIQGSDWDLALQALDAAIKLFDIDAVASRAATLATGAKAAKLPEEWGLLADGNLRLVDEAIVAENFEVAEKAASAAAQAARRANDFFAVAATAARAKEVSEAKARFDSVKKARDAVVLNPGDPAASSEIGQYLCLARNDWDTGRLLLLHGSDSALKSLAEKELAQPTQVGDMISVGDGWWDLAEKEKSAWKKLRFQNRAGSWYRQALPGATGIAQSKVQKRLAELDQANLQAIPMATRLRDGLVGWWKFEEGAGNEAKDSSPTRNHGTLKNGPEWTKGRFGKGLKFNGADSHVVVSPKPYASVTNTFTMTLWALPSGPDTFAIYPTQTFFGSLDHAGAGIRVSTAKIVVMEHTGNYLPSPISLAKESKTWTHIALVYVNRVPKLYVDGKHAADGPSSPKTVHPGCSIALGYDVKNCFSGVLDDFRIYNRALSEAEIQALAMQKGE